MKLSDLIQRSLTGAVFILALLIGILVNEYSYFVLFLVILVLALSELYKLLNDKYNVEISLTISVIGGVLFYIGAYLFFSTICSSFLAFIPFFAWFFIFFVLELYSKKKNPIASLAFSALGLLYIALPIGLTAYLAFNYNDDSYHYGYLLALFVFIWVNDSFAYLVGSLFGKHRLFERISPKKSWEGFLGGLTFTLSSSLLFAYFFPNQSLWVWLGIAFLVVVTGTLGDLLESLFKRTLEVKDSGNLLPGHGGVLDRFDSMLFSIIPVVIFLELVNHWT